MRLLLRLCIPFTTSCLGSMLLLFVPLQAFIFNSKNREEVKKYEYETLFIQHTFTMLANLTHKETMFKTSGFLPKLEKIINEIPLLSPATIASLSPQLLASLDALENKVKSKVKQQYRASLIKAFMSDGATFGNIVDLSDTTTFKIKVPQDILKTAAFEKTKNILNRITAAHLSLIYHAITQIRCIIVQLSKLFEWQKGSL